jgi:hypothetical protein
MIQNNMLARSLVLRRVSPATSSLGATTSTRMRKRRPKADYKALKEHNQFLLTRILDGQKRTNQIRVTGTWSLQQRIWSGSSGLQRAMI